MTAQLEEQFRLVEEIVGAAARSPVTRIPAELSQAVAIMESVRTSAAAVPANAREHVVARLQQFRTRLKIFSRAMQRGETILQTYARRTGIAPGHYGPAGVPVVGRDPEFFNFTA